MCEQDHSGGVGAINIYSTLLVTTNLVKEGVTLSGAWRRVHRQVVNALGNWIFEHLAGITEICSEQDEAELFHGKETSVCWSHYSWPIRSPFAGSHA
jgi:hypothetical protein